MLNNAKPAQIPLLLTRPRDGARAFWAALPTGLQQKLTPLYSPLLKIIPLAYTDPDGEAAIFTSANAVHHAPAGKNRRAYCVGANTTLRACECGWNAQQSGETAQQLIAALSQLPAHPKLVHFCGVHKRVDLAAAFAKSGIHLQEIPVYDQKRTHLTQAAHAAINANFPLLVPLFSPRTASQFARETKGHNQLHIIALSHEVAHEIAPLKTRFVHVAQRPTRQAMIDAVQMVAEHIALG